MPITFTTPDDLALFKDDLDLLSGDITLIKLDVLALQNRIVTLETRPPTLPPPIEPPSPPPTEPPVEPPVITPPTPPPTGGDRKTVLATSGHADGLIAAIAEAGTDKSIVRIPAGDWNLDKSVIAPNTCSFGAQGAKPRLQKVHRGEEFGGPAIAIFHTGQPAIHEFTSIILLARKATDREIGLSYSGAVDARVHDNEFHKFGRAGISILGRTIRFNAKQGHPVGVSWNNLYKDGLNSGGYLGYGIEIIGDDKHTDTLRPGSVRMFVVEDERFDGRRHATVGNNYSIYAVRHCTAMNQLKNAHTWDNHGLSAWKAGGRWVEIYENVVESNAPGVRGSNWGLAVRGGGGVVYRNSWKNRVTNGHVAVMFETGGNQSDANRTMWRIGSLIMPQLSDPDWTKQLHAWENFDRTGSLVAAESKSSQVVLDRDFFNTRPSDYAPLAYPHPWRTGYEV